MAEFDCLSGSGKAAYVPTCTRYHVVSSLVLLHNSRLLGVSLGALHSHAQLSCRVGKEMNKSKTQIGCGCVRADMT